MTNQHLLGLPLEYQQLPQYFDAHNISAETVAKNALIERLLSQQQVKSVLDLTCGTGSQVFYLQERGYEVVGSDFSPALVTMAREKALREGKNIRFLDGDMRDLQVGQFDAVITIFNAIGHLVEAEFEKALQNIFANLKPGGVYLFDIFNLDAITDEVVRSFSMNIESVVDGVKIQNIQHSEIDREKRLLSSHDQYFISKDNDVSERYTNSFSLQIYSAARLREMLSQNGFDIVQQYDMNGDDFLANRSLNILTVARRRKSGTHD